MPLNVITLTNCGPQILINPADLRQLGADFQRHHFIRLPNLIEPKLLNVLYEKTETAAFHRLEHKDVGSELGLSDPTVDALLTILLNNTELFHFVQAITGCPSIGSFIGRVYRYNPASDHYDEWHDDLFKKRVVALTINIGREPYEGGILELRDNSTGTIERVANTGFGDGILFQLADFLEHRRTAVKGSIAKTAIAGWFRTEPAFLDLIRQPS